jgi:hypothetical protein
MDIPMNIIATIIPATRQKINIFRINDLDEDGETGVDAPLIVVYL